MIEQDQTTKKDHEDSAHVACEAAGSIKTVASLVREDDCLRLYSKALEEPLQRSQRKALYGSILFALSQAQSFFVIALV
jgi:ATP-binding cassette, subfamily B (MDR/TAP), member 1